MHRDDVLAIWTVVIPPCWPDPPARMSVSALLEIEACPRRWALGSAHYPSIWMGAGYPEKPVLAALEGLVTHYSLSTIVRALLTPGCPSSGQSAVVQIMRDLGGYSLVMAEAVRRTLHDYARNPRCGHRLEDLHQKLLSRIPDIRRDIQTALQRLDLADTLGPREFAFQRVDGRTALSHGVYSEVRLLPAALPWVGVADLIRLSAAKCEIVDFKTGTPRPDHDFQVRVYAVLWARDETLNPCARHADRLVVSYRDHDVVVPPPGESEINALEVEMGERAEAAHAALAGDAPEARPGQEVCGHCHVRQLCTEYWRSPALCVRPLSASTSTLLVDLEASILDRERPLAWRGEVLAGGGLPPTATVVIQHPHGDVTHLSAIRDGQVVRLVDVVVTMPGADNPVPVVNFGVAGEAFAVLA